MNSKFRKFIADYADYETKVKAEAKRKFKVYPSAYANGWLVRTYKARGGRYRMG